MVDVYGSGMACVVLFLYDIHVCVAFTVVAFTAQ